jgi:hypothetical protein
MAMPSVQPRYCFIKKGVVKSGQAHATSIKPANFVDLLGRVATLCMRIVMQVNRTVIYVNSK